MIPESDKNGNLPPGIFEATIEEVEERFSINFQRKKLFGLLLEVLAIFRNCGCQSRPITTTMLYIGKSMGEMTMQQKAFSRFYCEARRHYDQE